MGIRIQGRGGDEDVSEHRRGLERKEDDKSRGNDKKVRVRIVGWIRGMEERV